MFRNRIKSILLAAAAIAVMTPAALAADGTSVTIIGGDLTITNPAASDFPATTLTGTRQTKRADLEAFTVNDARGTGLGWSVFAQATQFKDATGTKTFDRGSLTMSKPTVAADGTTSASPTVNDGPYTIDALLPVKVTSAGVNTGMGKYDFGATTLGLTIPADVYATTYSSDVTISVVAAP